MQRKIVIDGPGGGAYALTYDSDDVADIAAGAPHDVLTGEDGKRKLGTAYLDLRITFKPGKAPTWVNENKG